MYFSLQNYVLLYCKTQHQLQWQQAIKELEEKEGFIVPKSAESFEHTEFNHTLYNFSEGEDSKAVIDGETAVDGKPFKYEDKAIAMGEKPVRTPGKPELHNSGDHSPMKTTLDKGKELLQNKTDSGETKDPEK